MLITAAVLGGLVGTLMLRDPGYVLLAYAGRVLETSLWFAMAMLVLLYVVLRCIVFVAMRLFQGRSIFGAWRAERGERGAQRQTLRGLLLLAEGQWAEAKRVLSGAGKSAAVPFINYSQAARAAHELGDEAGRDEMLSRAEQSASGSATAVLLTRARLQMEAQQWQQCRATLAEVRETSPRHPGMLDMLRRCHEQLADWQALIDLLPDLRKTRASDAALLDDLQRRAWIHRLEAADYAEVWQRLPKDLKRDPELTAAWARRLLIADNPAAAERAVRKALDRTWHEQLVVLYGRIPSPDLARQMTAAEGWLQEHRNDAALMLTLGRIAMMNGAWSKAREYLEASLRLEPSVSVYGELGRLLTHLGEFIRGSEYLGKACPDLPNLPLPPRPGR